jgi:CheY-like chemotaxis protein
LPCARRILVVDDEWLVSEVIEAMLSSVGHEVISTQDPQKALELIGAEQFDLIITDLGMPSVNGWAVAGHAKARNSSIPVIVMTGWGMQYESGDVSSQGVDLMLGKPLEWASLAGAVERLPSASVHRAEEKRRHKRFRGRREECTRLITSSSNPGANLAWLTDISMGGISFLHTGDERATGALLSLDILSSRPHEVFMAQGRKECLSL